MGLKPETVVLMNHSRGECLSSQIDGLATIIPATLKILDPGLPLSLEVAAANHMVVKKVRTDLMMAV